MHKERGQAKRWNPGRSVVRRSESRSTTQVGTAGVRRPGVDAIEQQLAGTGKRGRPDHPHPPSPERRPCCQPKANAVIVDPKDPRRRRQCPTLPARHRGRTATRHRGWRLDRSHAGDATRRCGCAPPRITRSADHGADRHVLEVALRGPGRVEGRRGPRLTGQRGQRAAAPAINRPAIPGPRHSCVPRAAG